MDGFFNMDGTIVLQEEIHVQGRYGVAPVFSKGQSRKGN